MALGPTLFHTSDKKAVCVVIHDVARVEMLLECVVAVAMTFV